MKLLLPLLCLVNFSAHAGIFQGQTTGTFVNPMGPTGMVTNGANTNQFNWGSPAPPSNASSIAFDGAIFEANENEEFVLGTLTTENGTIIPGTEATAIDINFIVNFTMPSTGTENFIFHLNLDNTSNNLPSGSSDDYVNFINTVPEHFFSYAGVDYTLELLGFGQITGTGFIEENSLITPENSMVSVELLGQITSTPIVVPVPAALWLFGSGLIGLYGTRQLRKA